MNDKTDKRLEEIINSMDEAARAEPAPYLLTRINARLQRGNGQLTIWDKIIQVMASPFIAIATIILVLSVNFYIYTSNTDSDQATNMGVSSNTGLIDEYSVTSATAVYDLENIQQ